MLESYFEKEIKQVSYKSSLCDVTEMPLIAAVKMSPISDKRKHEHIGVLLQSFIFVLLLILDLRHI